MIGFIYIILQLKHILTKLAQIMKAINKSHLYSTISQKARVPSLQDAPPPDKKFFDIEYIFQDRLSKTNRRYFN